jgi:hypothetical protein
VSQASSETQAAGVGVTPSAKLDPFHSSDWFAGPTDPELGEAAHARPAPATSIAAIPAVAAATGNPTRTRTRPPLAASMVIPDESRPGWRGVWRI